MQGNLGHASYSECSVHRCIGHNPIGIPHIFIEVFIFMSPDLSFSII
jgi:hypothetical protein